MRKLTLIFLFFLSSKSFAQNFFITSNFGLMGYGGDLEPKAISLNVPHSTYSFGLTYELSRHVFINSLYTRGMIEGNDAYALKNRERNLKFKSKINEFSIGAEYDFLDLYNLPVTPFVQANFSIFHFNPFLEEGVKTYYLKDYHTEGQGFLPNVPEYSLTQFAVPLGVGFKIALSENIKAGLLLSIRKTFTDYLDDCSANYVDSVSLHNFFKDPKQGDLAVHLAYRKNLLNKDLYYSAAVSPGIKSKRGDPTNNDNFFTLGLTLSIRLGKKYSEEMDFEKYNKVNVSCPKKNTFIVPKIKP